MLAIGLVVDDAIVVVEAVEHHIEQGLSPQDATLKAMEEVSGPVVAIALILAAVFVPTAFIPGITGRLYQQFAVTIAVSVMISAFNALTLSPALAALLLRPRSESARPAGRRSSAGSTACSAAPPTATSRWSAHPDPQVGASRWSLLVGRRPSSPASVGSRLPAASSRTRTRATCT